MPQTRIEVIAGRSPAEKRALLDAVHEAFMEAFKTPAWDNNQRLLEYPASGFDVPPGRTTKRTLIECTIYPGRSREAKKRLYRAIVAKLSALGTPPNDVFIVLLEPPLENFGIRGGQAAGDVELGFEVRV